MSHRKIIATAALPYANGEIHLGHLVEYIQTDIWVRFQKMRGHECYYICGSDAHGTPIMLKAEERGITPEALIAEVKTDQYTDLSAFQVDFDNFHTTHSEENRELATLIYEKLKANGDITSREVTQAYDPEKNMFLPDRFVKGECPKCGTKDQYGDNCESCGSTYNPNDLVNPISVVSGATPIEKSSEHFFFDLAKYKSILEEWFDHDHLQPEVKNKLKEWFDVGLQAWDISRDEPYFGFKIPGTKNKYFYVWLDAPIGYMASFKNFCASHPEIDFDEFWNEGSKTELHHFIGKDVMYFHALFWPAILYGAKFRRPTTINVHGFLTVNGEKMSKSRGTFITAKQYLKTLDPEYIRYYYAAKLNRQVEDIDLNFEDFRLRVNSDLVGKVVNIASRCAGFITKKFDGMLASELADKDLYQTFLDKNCDIAELYESLDYNKAMREIMALADLANQYVDKHAPWILAKDESKLPEVQLICTEALNLFKLLATYLKPVLPVMSEKVETFLQTELTWDSLAHPLLNCKIEKFKPLMQRIQPEDIEQFGAKP